MEIIKTGITPKTWRKTCKCPRCMSHLKISIDDIDVEVNSTILDKIAETFTDRITFRYYITCDVCKCKIDITKVIPSVIKSKIIERMSNRLMNFLFRI